MTDRMQSYRAKSVILLVALLCAVIAAAAFQYKLNASWVASLERLETAEFAPDDVRNYRWAKGGSLRDILAPDTPLKPPVYPVYLFAADALGADDIRYANLAVLLFLMGLVVAIAAKSLSTVETVFLALFVTAFVPFYSSAILLISYPLFLITALACFLATVSYCRNPGRAQLMVLSMCLAVACFTHYIGLLWLLPVSLICIALLYRDDWRTLLKHWLVLSLIALPPTLIFMFSGDQEPGAIAGMDRFARIRVDGYSWWLSFGETLRDFLTTFVDDFSTLVTSHYAAGYQDHWLEYLLNTPLLLSAGFLFYSGIRKTFKPAIAMQGSEAGDAQVYWLVAAAYLASYVFVILAFWPVSSNDPLYTRFLLGIYPFVFMFVARGYSLMREQRPGYLLWFQIALAGLLLVQVYKLLRY